MTIELQEITRQVNEATKHIRDAIARVEESTAQRSRAEIEYERAWDAAFLASDLKTEAMRKSDANIKTTEQKERFIVAKGEQQVAKSALHSWNVVCDALKAIAWGHHQEVKLEAAS